MNWHPRLNKGDKHMRLSPTFLTSAAFALAVVVSTVIAGGAATIIEQRSRSLVRVELEAAGYSWAHVETDGLLVEISGTAPSEASRFRAVTKAGSVVEATRVVDLTEVEVQKEATPPSFSLEILRNDDGISLIGLVPASLDREAFMARISKIAGDTNVKDMLEVADYDEPKNWQAALDFGMVTLETLPRSKISVEPGKIAVTAITDSAAEKARIDADLARRRPASIALKSDISAPRPVITPFTLRFVIDNEGARFDACSADTDRAKARILSAARLAGASGDLGCTVGMGTPSTRWGEAVEMSLKALKELGAGLVTVSDADISLVAADTVTQGDFDRIVGELESNLPDVFSLKAELTKKADGAAASGPEFSAVLSPKGQVQLRGRLSDERLREAAETLAKARFGASNVYGATRVDDTLPAGWALRSLSAIEALAQLAEGKAVVTPELITVNGVSGNTQASDMIARILTDRLGERTRIDLDIRYDKRLDPILGLPTGPECTAMLNGALAQAKINFEPGASVIAEGGGEVLDTLAEMMGNCADFKMEIAGHTDSQGSDGFNNALSEDRAMAVMRALMERRVNTENLTAQGYGPSQPVASNDTEEGREANRRIEFVLLDEAPVNRPQTLPPADEALPAAEAAPDAKADTASDAAAPEATPEDQPEAADAVNDGTDGTDAMDDLGDGSGEDQGDAPADATTPDQSGEETADTPSDAAEPATQSATESSIVLQPAGPDTKRPKARPEQN